MNILSINTSSSFGEIEIDIDGKIFSKKIQSPYSENIMTNIQEVLELANANLSDIDALAIVTGPGSFTGIRIGMAVVKGLFCGQEKKLISINSFELVSYNINDNNFVVILDSGNTDLYYAIFKDKKITEMGFGEIEKIDEFAKSEGVKVYYSIQDEKKFELTPFEMVECEEYTLSKLAKEKANACDFARIENIAPIYIKLSQAEVGLKQKIEKDLSFRPAQKSDVSALSVIDSQCFESGAELYSKKSFEDELLEVSKHYIVAVLDDLQIGYIGMQTLGDELNLLKIAVLPQYQKLGIGAKLLQKSIEYFENNNLSNYFLEVREDNNSAIKLYKKFGFETISKREKYYGDKTALVMFLKK